MKSASNRPYTLSDNRLTYFSQAANLLSVAAKGSDTAKSQIIALLNHVAPSRSLSPRLTAPSPTSFPRAKCEPHRPPGPYPGATPVLARPYPSTSGRRHVPKLVNANGVPFLRFKKPQSPFLSRIIRDKIKQRTRNFELMHALEDSRQAAADEDRWDELILEEYGVGDGVGLEGTGEGGKWVDVVSNGRRFVGAMINEHEMKCREVGRKMQGIVEREEELTRRERGERKRVQSRERMERKQREERVMDVNLQGPPSVTE
ncbi:MAG: hypothetical protein M1836_003132 [Candelina mexicana]|nr:MAG: hypothetical protein M1836_003132 [Candelina mexicana]